MHMLTLANKNCCQILGKMWCSNFILVAVNIVKHIEETIKVFLELNESKMWNIFHSGSKIKGLEKVGRGE